MSTPNRERDVVFGSRGNRHIPAYRELILDHVDDYATADDHETRQEVLAEVQSTIESSGGKFWVEAEKGTFEVLEDPSKYIRTSMTGEIGNRKKRQTKEKAHDQTTTPTKNASKSTTRAALEPGDDEEEDEKPIKKISAAAKSKSGKSTKKPAASAAAKSAAANSAEPDLEKDVVFGSRKFKSNWYKLDDHWFRQLIHADAERFHDQIDERQGIIAAIQKHVEEERGARFWKRFDDGSYKLLTDPTKDIKKSIQGVQVAKLEKQKREKLRQEQESGHAPDPPVEVEEEDLEAEKGSDTEMASEKGDKATGSASKPAVKDDDASEHDSVSTANEEGENPIAVSGSGAGAGADHQDPLETEETGPDGADEEEEPKTWWSSIVSVATYVAGSLFGQEFVENTFGKKRQHSSSEQASPQEQPRKRRRLSGNEKEEEVTI